jgi:hypothetical protein
MPTGRPCTVVGCRSIARNNPWAPPRCERHRQRERRWLDALQPALQPKTINPLIRQIKQTISQDRTGKIEAVVIQLYQNLRGYVESVEQDLPPVRRFADGRRPRYRALSSNWTARAAQELLRSLSETKPLDAACVAGALFLLRHYEPARFVSEDGWLGTFVRTWRKCCGTIAFGSYWDHRLNRKRPVYRELPQRVTREIGGLLVTTYAPFAAYLLAHERRKAKLPQTIKNYLEDGFKSVEENSTSN